MKVLISCANGSGTSLMAKMTFDKVAKKLNINVEKLHHCSIGEGKNAAIQYDVVFCPQNFTNMFDGAKAKGVEIIGLRNVMSAKEMEDKLKERKLI